MKELTARQHAWGKALVLPFVVLGFLLVPFVLLPAHGLAGHAATMPPSAPIASHSSDGHSHGPDEAGTSIPASTVDSPGNSGPGHDAPFCDAGPDYSAVTVHRHLNDAVDLAVLLVAAAFVTVVIASGLSPSAWALQLRHWFSKPPWRVSGTAFLSLACISRI